MVDNWQIRRRVFNQSTLSAIGDRVRELCLPVPTDKQRQNTVAKEVEKLVRARRESLRKLRDKMTAGATN